MWSSINVTASLAPGTYYINVEGFSSFSFGDFDLSVSGVLDQPEIGNIVGPFIVCPESQGGYTVLLEILILTSGLFLLVLQLHQEIILETLPLTSVLFLDLSV